MANLYRALMWAGSVWCHQIPERSPHVFGIQLPLCWRCSGIAMGVLILMSIALTLRKFPKLGLSLALASLMPIDVFSAMFGLWQGDNTLRFVTGILWGIFGIAAGVRMFSALIRRAGEIRLAQGWRLQ